jgi:hypothetical protein
MKRLLIFGAVLIFSGTAFAQVKYKTYVNGRFGYSILYPYELLQIQPPPFNGDGRRFLSKDKGAEMAVWGNFNALFRTVNEEYQGTLKDYGDGVTYKVLLKNGFVISGIKNDKIYYQKTLYHKFKENLDVFYTFTIEYKKSDREKFDAVIQKIAESFKFDPKADV